MASCIIWTVPAPLLSSTRPANRSSTWWKMSHSHARTQGVWSADGWNHHPRDKHPSLPLCHLVALPIRWCLAKMSHFWSNLEDSLRDVNLDLANWNCWKPPVPFEQFFAGVLYKYITSPSNQPTTPGNAGDSTAVQGPRPWPWWQGRGSWPWAWWPICWTRREACGRWWRQGGRNQGGWGWLGGCDDPGVDSTISYQLHHVCFIVLILALR